jgi:N-acetylmuramoyl-L-alanine amidase
MQLLLLYLFAVSSPQYKIVIDPGHGGSNLGALAFDGKTHEKELTMDLAKRISSKLNKLNIYHKLTRTTDKYMTLFNRTEIARKSGAICFISLHFNASPLHNKTGIEIFYPEKLTAPEIGNITFLGKNGSSLLKKSRSVRDLIISSYLLTLKKSLSSGGSIVFAKKMAWRLTGDKFKLRRVAEGNFDVLMGSGIRAILFEGGFIDNAKEGSKILNPQYREKMAGSLVKGIKSLCSSKKQIF